MWTQILVVDLDACLAIDPIAADFFAVVSLALQDSHHRIAH